MYTITFVSFYICQADLFETENSACLLKSKLERMLELEFEQMDPAHCNAEVKEVLRGGLERFASLLIELYNRDRQ